MRHSTRSWARSGRIVAGLWLTGLTGLLVAGGAGPATAAETDGPTAPMRLPLAFVPNLGQAPASAHFHLLGAAGPVLLGPSGVALSRFVETDAGGAVRRGGLRSDLSHAGAEATAGTLEWARLRFENSEPSVEMVSEERLPGVANFLMGSDPAGWRTKVPTYAALRYRGLYPGVDLVVDGRDGALHFTWLVAPGADASAVGWRLEGAAGSVAQLAKAAGQAVGVRQRKDGSFGLSNAHLAAPRGVAGARPLAVTVAYATYLGGGLDDRVSGLAVDDGGSALVTGATASTSFPTRDPFQGAMGNTSGTFDAFVSKLAPAGAPLVYSTYIGGNAGDAGEAIALDEAGGAVVAGWTASRDFPVRNAAQPVFGGSSDTDGLVLRLTPAGDGLVFSTFLGGQRYDPAYAVAVAPGSGDIVVAGLTASPNFPTTAGAFATRLAGDVDAYIARLGAAGAGPLFATLLGGREYDQAVAIDVDAAGAVYAAGTTYSANFPVAAPLQRSRAGDRDAFVAKLAPDGKTLDYGTYLGGRSADQAAALVVEAAGAVHLAGVTNSPDFPAPGALRLGPRGGEDAFVASLAAGGSRVTFGALLGGGNADGANGLTRDGSGRLVLAGSTASANFPTLAGSPAWRGGVSDAFVVALDPAAGGQTFGVLHGGPGTDLGAAVAVDGAGGVYAAGSSSSSDLLTLNAVQATWSGKDDGFVVKFGDALPPVVVATATPTATETATPVPNPAATAIPTLNPPTLVPTTGVPTATELPSPTATTRPFRAVYLPFVAHELLRAP